MPQLPKPDCYVCIHRRTLPGSAHSRCAHPETGKVEPDREAMAILASVGRVPPVVNTEAAAKLRISAERYGLSRGWFNWPYSFDPVWLRNCDGFTKKETGDAPAT